MYSGTLLCVARDEFTRIRSMCHCFFSLIIQVLTVLLISVHISTKGKESGELRRCSAVSYLIEGARILLNASAL